MNKRIIGYVFLFFSSILLFLISFLCILKFTVLSKSYVFDKIDEVDFYSKSYDEVIREMSYYTNQSGFTDDFLNDIFSVSDIKRDINSVVSNLYIGKSIDVDVSNIESKFSNKILTYISDNNYKEVNKSELDSFVDKMISIYKDEVSFMGYTSKISPFVPKVISLVNEALCIFSLMFIVLVIINKKVFHRKSYGVLFFTCSFLFVFLDIYIFSHIDVSNLFIYSDVVSDLVKSIISDLFGISLFVIFIYFIMGILFSFFRKSVKRQLEI